MLQSNSLHTHTHTQINANPLRERTYVLILVPLRGTSVCSLKGDKNDNHVPVKVIKTKLQNTVFFTFKGTSLVSCVCVCLCVAVWVCVFL